MCGIHVTISRHGFVAPDQSTLDLLRHRGPDSLCSLNIELDGRASFGSKSSPKVYLTLTSSVLSLRGDHVVRQPISGRGIQSREVQSPVLCWNGEAWALAGCPISGNDGELIYRALCHVPSSPDSEMVRDIARILSSFAGPYAFAFLDTQARRLFFGRDFLGRRSLLHHRAPNGDVHICSVSTAAQTGWDEIDAGPIHWLELSTSAEDFEHHKDMAHVHAAFPLKLSDPSARSLDIKTSLTIDSHSVADLERHLRNALEPRLRITPPVAKEIASVAVLFSGGLDCTVLARLAHEILPADHVIDLLNVAFENPRVHKMRGPQDSPYELCPDRQTGRQSHAELQQVCPGRTWRFVAIDIPYSETCAERNRILSLIYPHDTEMDLSIGCALYFAVRGAGVVECSDGRREYRTPARILLSGLGADELFGGYSRHAIAFERGGYRGLHAELELDVGRLGKRNLGRDDRVISHWAREARFPFLDETLVRWAIGLPLRAKCGLGQTIESAGNGHPDLEPGKLVLRCLAWRLGMRVVAKEKKRAASPVTHSPEASD